MAKCECQCYATKKLCWAIHKGWMYSPFSQNFFSPLHTFVYCYSLHEALHTGVDSSAKTSKLWCWVRLLGTWQHSTSGWTRNHAAVSTQNWQKQLDAVDHSVPSYVYQVCTKHITCAWTVTVVESLNKSQLRTLSPPDDCTQSCLHCRTGEDRSKLKYYTECWSGHI